jgi:tellurite resistance protein TerC
LPWWIWTSFVVLVTVLVVLDLCVLNRKSHVISIREALGWTAFWIALALVFNAVVYLLYSGQLLPGMIATEHMSGGEAALQFFTGYIVEKSLSLDNIFVIAMIIANFHVPPQHQHRLLFWGILAAALLRGIMIIGGTMLLEQFHGLMYIFGGVLIYSAIKMLVSRHDNLETEDNMLLKLTRRFYPVTTEFHGNQFFTVIEGRKFATPMLLALVLIESSDVMFAVDSIPAVMAITRDPFLVFTSNIFAILGLRSLYFALAGLMDRFSYLKVSLVFLLVYIGLKMIVTAWYHPVKVIPDAVSLVMIAGILAVGIFASIRFGDRDTAKLHSPLEELATGETSMDDGDPLLMSPDASSSSEDKF